LIQKQDELKQLVEATDNRYSEIGRACRKGTAEGIDIARDALNGEDTYHHPMFPKIEKDIP